MRFHLIDRIDEWVPGESARGRKLTSRSEDYWEEDAEGAVMPPPFLLEALCQAGTWLVMLTTQRRRRAALLSAGAVEWLGAVRPGDVLDLACRVDSMGEASAVVSGEVSVDGRTVLVAREVMVALIAADELAADEDMERLQGVIAR